MFKWLTLSFRQMYIYILIYIYLYIYICMYTYIYASHVWYNSRNDSNENHFPHIFSTWSKLHPKPRPDEWPCTWLMLWLPSPTKKNRWLPRRFLLGKPCAIFVHRVTRVILGNRDAMFDSKFHLHFPWRKFSNPTRSSSIGCVRKKTSMHGC